MEVLLLCLLILNSHPYDSGLIIADKNGHVEKWLAKEDERPQWYDNRVNAGLHVIDPKVLDIGLKSLEINKESGFPQGKVDLDRQILKPLCGSNMMFCYDSPEYVKDMGYSQNVFTKWRLIIKMVLFRQRILPTSRKSYSLIRDGTINKICGIPSQYR